MKLYKEPDWLRQKYLDEDLSQREIGALAVCTDVCVSQWMRRYGIPVRTQRPDLDDTLHDRDWLWWAYVEDGISFEELAQELGCAYSVVAHWAHKFGLPVRGFGHAVYGVGEDWLRKQYAELKLSVQEIAELVGCSGWVINHSLECYGIDKRDKGEIMFLAHQRQRGSYGTQEYGDKIAATKMGARNPAWKGGVTPEYQRVRGSLEYAEWREQVLDRYDWACVVCGGFGPIAHHLASFSDNLELRMDVDNGVAMCKACHVAFHDEYGRGNNTLEQFDEFYVTYGRCGRKVPDEIERY